MSPNRTIGGELQFQQRWESRRKDDDFDSSSGDSKSSSIGEPVLKKHKLVTGLISFENNETSNASILQQNHNCNIGFRDQIEFAKAIEKKIKRGKKISSADTKMKKDSHEEVDTKKSKTIVYDPAALDDVRNFRESLLEDLKATGEYLFTWMREEMNKLVADDIAPKRGRRKRISRGKKVQLQNQNSRNNNMQVQKHVNFEKTVQQNNIEENIRVQHINNNGAFVQMNQQSNFDNDNEVQPRSHFEKNIQAQHQNNFKSGMGSRKCNDGSSERLGKSVKAADSNNYSQALERQVGYVREIRPVTSIEKEKGQRLALTVNSNVQFGPYNQIAHVQHPKSVVLAIRAQNCNDGFAERSARRKKNADPKNNCQVPEDRVGYNQVIGSMKLIEKDKAERLKLSVEKSSSPNCADQEASSMYLTLPPVLSKPHDSNSWLDTFLSSYIQPRVSGNKTSENLEIAKQMYDSSTHFGYLPNIQPEKMSSNFAQMGSTSVSCFDQNGTQTASTGTGFLFPLHHSMNSAFSIPSRFSLENIPQESGNILGLQMIGGAVTFSGGSYALSENFVANNHLNHSNYRGDRDLCLIKSQALQMVVDSQSSL